MEKGLTREECLTLLQRKQEELGRMPKRSDCTVDEVVRIKAFYGPWPRALEAAGIKEPRSTDRKQLNREKRIRAKRNRIRRCQERRMKKET